MVYSLSVLITINVLLQAAWGSVVSPNKNVGVIGGQTVAIEAVPFMVSLFHNGEAECGGTIIHERFILTAAYCLLGKPETNWKVLVGSNRSDKDGDFIDVEKVFEYHPYELIENIGLLKLKEPLTFGPKVAKISLLDTDQVVGEGTMVNVTGWGRTDISNEPPNELHQATIPVVANGWCGDLRDTMLCAGGSNQGACYGDNGGALTYNNVQIGVVAMVLPNCVNQPAIFAKISSYRPWIDTTIKNKL